MAFETIISGNSPLTADKGNIAADKLNRNFGKALERAELMDTSGKIKPEKLPPLDILDTYQASSQTLEDFIANEYATSGVKKNWNIAIIDSESEFHLYRLFADDGTNVANYKEFNSKTMDWSNILGKPDLMLTDMSNLVAPNATGLLQIMEKLKTVAKNVFIIQDSAVDTTIDPLNRAGVYEIYAYGSSVLDMTRRFLLIVSGIEGGISSQVKIDTFGNTISMRRTGTYGSSAWGDWFTLNLSNLMDKQMSNLSGELAPEAKQAILTKLSALAADLSNTPANLTDAQKQAFRTKIGATNLDGSNFATLGTAQYCTMAEPAFFELSGNTLVITDPNPAIFGGSIPEIGEKVLVIHLSGPRSNSNGIYTVTAFDSETAGTPLTLTYINAPLFVLVGEEMPSTVRGMYRNTADWNNQNNAVYYQRIQDNAELAMQLASVMSSLSFRLLQQKLSGNNYDSLFLTLETPFNLPAGKIVKLQIFRRIRKSARIMSENGYFLRKGRKKKGWIAAERESIPPHQSNYKPITSFAIHPVAGQLKYNLGSMDDFVKSWAHESFISSLNVHTYALSRGSRKFLDLIGNQKGKISLLFGAQIQVFNSNNPYDKLYCSDIFPFNLYVKSNPEFSEDGETFISEKITFGITVK